MDEKQDRYPYEARNHVPSDRIAPSGRFRRSWQNDTWTGPAPLMRDPFDEPENAPELRKIRSESLEDRNGSFWKEQDTVTEGYSFRKLGMEKENGYPEVTQKSASGRKTRVLVSTLLIVIAAIVALRVTIFNISRIQVTGNKQYTVEQIVQLSGVQKGDNLLFLREADVQRRIESDYRLQFSYMEKEFPGSVTIAVREREACSWITYCGITYVMDKKGIILFETEDTGVVPANLSEIKGLMIRNIYTGQKISLVDQKVMDVYENLFLELRVMTCVENVQEVDLTNPDDIYMKLRDGYVVRLGDIQNLHAKLRATLLVHSELMSQQMYSGTINVTDPEKPIYTPDMS